MKKYSSLLALLFVSLSFVLMPATAKAAMWDVPVAPGESFRWVFVTSTTTPATSSDIDYYNDFVNDVADAAATPITDVVGFSSIAEIEWKAIGSTDTTDAIDNIVVTTTDIYTPLGVLVASGTADMFDNSIDTPLVTTELGTQFTLHVWTGSMGNGRASDNPLGMLDQPVGVGRTPDTDVGWICWGLGQPSTYGRPMYAISEELTVVPLPGTVLLGILGLGVAGVKLRKYT